MKIIGQHLLVGLGCLAMTACAAKKIMEVRDYNATYVCDGGQPVKVHYTPYNAALQDADASVAMIQQPADDGFRYSGEGQSLHAQGAQALWTDGKGTVHHCRETFGAATQITIPNR